MVTLIDSSVLLDIATEDEIWYEWSATKLEDTARESVLAINPIIYAEVSVSYRRIEEVENVVPADVYVRLGLPFEAAFLAGKAHREYRNRGGRKTSTLPDFFIGAHAAVSGFRLLTRDPRRFRRYFPTVGLMAPDTE